MAIAFFDLDKTLIARNSAAMWIRSERRLGFITRWQSTRAAMWLIRYSLGWGDVREAMRESIASLSGKSEADLRERSHAFFRKDVLPLMRPGAHQSVARHRAEGHRLVLLTSSSEYLSECATEAFALDDYICTRFEVLDDGTFSGAPVEPLCYGSGKVKLAEEYVRTHGVGLEECTFYSDSTSDLPMLEAVGNPVVINPDPRLRRIGQRKGWPTHDWGHPNA